MPERLQRVDEDAQLDQRFDRDLRWSLRHADAAGGVRHPRRDRWDVAETALEHLLSITRAAAHDVDRLSEERVPRIVDGDALSLVGGM